MIKTLFLVPLSDNDGVPCTRSNWRELDVRIRAEFNAYSLRSPVYGTWQSNGRTYRDRSREYVIALDHWTELPTWLDLIYWVCDRF